MLLPALAAQLQGFAHSANNVDVGVRLRKVLTIPASLGSLIPTYLLLLFLRGWWQSAVPYSSLPC